MGRPFLLLLLSTALAGCGGDGGSASPRGEGGGGAAAVDRDAWWAAATSGAALAPRELRALLAEGRRRGFDDDEAWWRPRVRAAHAAILSVDPEDVGANAAVGRRTLTSLPGFEALWTRMIETRVPNDAIRDLLDRYEENVYQGVPVFLTEDEVTVLQAQLRDVETHLDRLDADPRYAARRHALLRVQGSALGGYPFVTAEIGPFLVFYCARDLLRIEGEDPADEDRRQAGRRAHYEKMLASWRPVYEGLLADVEKLYPELWKKHAPGADAVFVQYVFGDRGWFQDYTDEIGRGEGLPRYRCGFLEKKSNWAFLFEPAPAADAAAPEDGEAGPPPVETPDTLPESLAYLAARQLLRHWGRDGLDNRLDYSRAYWLKDGWASYLAARRVESPSVGPVLREAKRIELVLPPLRRVVDRESALDLRRYIEPLDPDPEPEDRPLPVQGAFTDLAWLLVQRLHEDDRRAEFERYLLGQIERTGPDFADCFGIRNERDWNALAQDVYSRIGKDS